MGENRVAEIDIVEETISIQQIPTQNSKTLTEKRREEGGTLEEYRGEIEQVYFLCHLSSEVSMTQQLLILHWGRPNTNYFDGLEI